MPITIGYQRFAAYYITGWGTEASKTRSPYVFTPAFTKTDPTTGKTSSGGVSLGVLQVDLSQNQPLAQQLFLAYDQWRQANNKAQIALSDLTALTNQLVGEKGKALNEFLATPGGNTLVDGWNGQQVTDLLDTRASSNIVWATYFASLNDQQQMMVAAATYKANNARGDTAGKKLVDFMNGLSVNGIQISANDDADQIMDKFRQVLQTKLTSTYGDIAKRDTLLALDKAKALYDILSSPAFADARVYLEDTSNSLTGVQATAPVQAQLTVLRVLSVFEAEGRGAQNRLLTDPATGNRVFYTGGADPARQAAIVGAPDGHSGWLMSNGQMVQFQDGEAVIRYNTGANGLLRVSALGTGTDPEWLLEFEGDQGSTTRYFASAAGLNEIDAAQANSIHLASQLLKIGGDVLSLDRAAAAALVDRMMTPILVADIGGGTGLVDPAVLQTNAKFMALRDAIQNDPNLNIIPAADGSSVAIVGDGVSMLLTRQGVLVQPRQDSSTGEFAADILTGSRAGQTITVAISGTLTDAQISGLGTAFGMSFAPGTDTGIMPNIPVDAFNGTITGTITRTGTSEVIGSLTLSPLFNENGERIGTVRVETRNELGAQVTIETQQYFPGQDIAARTTVVSNDLNGQEIRALYVDGQYQGITQINGAAVSAGLNKQFIAALVEQGVENPTPDDIARLSQDLGANATSRDIAMRDALAQIQGDAVLGTDYYGNPTYTSRTEASLQNISNGVGTLIDALSLVRAIQTGDPLPIVASGLRLAAAVDYLDGTRDLPGLGAASSIAGSVLSLYGLANALEQGDGIAAITSAAYVVKGVADAAAFLQTSGVIQEVPAALVDAGQFLGEALPYLNLVNSIAHGDTVGAAVAVVDLAMINAGIYSIPYVGWAYAVYSLVSSLFGDDDDVPDPWGSGQYVWNGTGIGIQSAGETGGNEAVANIMNSVLSTMNALIAQERAQNPGSALGIIPNRMPTVGYGMDGYRYTDIDPLSGAEKHPSLRFDTSGKPYNATPGSPEAFMSLGEAMIRSAIARGAIAPEWEVQTAKLQTDAGDPKAGLTEEERAGRDGRLAAPETGATQIFRPVALDMDGDGIETLGKDAAGVAFDVDDSGFLKGTGWLTGEDAFLTLDRNYNGRIDSGREMFSNGTVDISRRGLAGMAWVDANYDGKLTALDPVWDEIQVWQDADADGNQDAGELNGLDALGITELNYGMGRFVQNGMIKELGSPDLTADTAGTNINVVPEGIIVETSGGNISLLVTRIDDLTQVQANRDGVSGYEDIELIISGADLLANDTVGGFLGRDLTLTGLTGFRHGSGFIDANGFVHFTPEANYYGADAGFDYIAQAINGQEGTGTVEMSLQNINDAPTVNQVDHTYRPIYGYTDDDGNGQYEALYTPGWGYDENWNYDYRTAPITQDDSGAGQVEGTDVDDAAGTLSYQIVGDPQYGAVTVDASGNFQYTGWSAPNTPSAPHALGDEERQDSFQVKVTDPHGASVTQTVYVTHYGPYTPPTPPGGGGGKKPIAIDLNGNGFEFVDVDDSNIFFDVNGDGWKERTAWVAPGDGLLAYDVNGDGQIDQAGEISFAGYKAGAQSDLEGLSAFDSNGDGVFTAADEAWSKFGVWQDANQNGTTDAGEFRSLSEMGVAAIGLTSDGQFAIVNGQTVRGVGTMTMSDGSALALADATLAYTNEVQVTRPDGTTNVVTRSPFSPNGEVLEGTPDKDLILGKNGNNIVYAYAGDDVVFEDGGNDIIDGGDGNDLIYSGADNDLVIGGNGDDTVFAGLGSDMVFGGDGHDAIFAEGGNDVVFAGSGNDLIAGGWGNDVLSGDAGDDQVYGESGNDALFGRDGNDELAGMDGYDRLDGGAGNDLLDGGADADEMIGGTGDDTYVVDNVADVVTELAGEGVDTVLASIDYTLADTLENLTLTGTAALDGIGNAQDNRLIGNSGANILRGEAGNDRLDGGIGADQLLGGVGDDTYGVDNAGDAVTENAGEGRDTVRASVSYALTNNVEDLVLTGALSLSGTGNALDNTLTGNLGDNVLDGGLGVDTMQGGRGEDSYVVDDAGDVVIEQAGEGQDTIYSGVSYVLPANVENLVLTGSADIDGAGNELDNIIVGNSGANRIDGGAGDDLLLGNAGDDQMLGGNGNDQLDGGVGADSMVGGAGDDIYVMENIGDMVTELPGEGVDTARSGISYALTDNVENLTLTGTADLDGTGNGLDNVILGNSGANRIDGGLGADAMAGGAGDDVYVVDNAGDTITEQPGEGIDQAYSSVGHALSANVENLTLTGTENIDGSGNDLDNMILGNAGNNRLDGGAGADQMAGGAGDDSYVVDNAGDTVTELPGAGMDIVYSSVSYVLPEHVENMTLTGGDNIDATGNGLDNTLIGNAGDNVLLGLDGNDTIFGEAGNDRLNGGAGADSMAGGIGDDVYVVDDSSDLVTEGVDAGTDLVESGISYALTDNVENLTLTGTADIDGTGNVLDNAIVGNSGANRIDGGLGADTMAGDAGDDAYIVDNAGDTVTELPGEGTDIIYSSVSYVLPENVENLTLTGIDSVDGTGNGLDNILIGNTGDNVLSGLDGNDQLSGLSGNDTLLGGAGDDTLFGDTGNDVVDGGDGNDTFLYNVGDGLDTLSDASGVDSVQFGAGIGFDTVAIRVTELDGVKTAHLRILNAGGCEMPDQGMDFVLDANGVSPVESFRFADGSAFTMDDLLIQTKYFYGTPKTTTIRTGRHDDIIYAGPAANTVYAGTGNDIVYGQQRNDTLYGEGGDDYLAGNEGNDVLDGGCGTDILSGGNGDDVLRDPGGGNAALLGGHGRDTITGGTGNDFVAGGKHDDVLDGGAGYNVFAFGNENGRDLILPALGASNTLSLGDVDYDDLKFRKSGTNLVLESDSDSSITFKGWYADAGNRNFVTLQVVSETDDDDGHGHSERHDDDDQPFDAVVETFDFQALVTKFDEAQAANPKLSRWSLMNGMLDAHLASSDGMALGGDLAFHYGQEDGLKGMGLLAAQGVLKDPNFGAQAQAVHPWSSLEGGAVKVA